MRFSEGTGDWSNFCARGRGQIHLSVLAPTRPSFHQLFCLSRLNHISRLEMTKSKLEDEEERLTMWNCERLKV